LLLAKLFSTNHYTFKVLHSELHATHRYQDLMKQVHMLLIIIIVFGLLITSIQILDSKNKEIKLKQEIKYCLDTATPATTWDQTANQFITILDKRTKSTHTPTSF
jgi:hypothetical protein